MRRLFALALALSSASASAQWTPVYQTGSNEGIRAFATDGERLFAGVGRSPGGSDVIASMNGESWSSLGAPFPDFGYVVEVLYAKDGVLLAGYSGAQRGGVVRSDDGGATWRLWNEGFGNASNYVYDLSVADGVAFAATIQGVYRARLGDAEWKRTPGDIPPSTYGVVSVARRGTTVVAGNFGSPFSDPESGGIYRSDDDGASWILAESPFGGIDEVFDIEATATGFIATGTARAPSSGLPLFSGSAVSTDGVSWTVPGGLPRLGFPARVVAYQGGAFAFGNPGVFYSPDGLTGWRSVGDGLPDSDRVGALIAFGGFLYVYVFASGQVWRRPLAGVVSSEAAPGIAEALRVGVPVPNPARSRVRVSVAASGQSAIVVEIVAMDGRVVRAFSAVEADAGSLDLNVDGLAAGAYILRVRAGSETAAAPLTVVR